MGRPVPESIILKVWLDSISLRPDLMTEGGGSVRVIYPGRIVGNHGADIKDAVVSFGGLVKGGDIEIHARASDWHRHNHQKDPAYNRVILHVVMQSDGTESTPLQNGGSADILEIRRYLESGMQALELAETPPDSSLACRRLAEQGGGEWLAEQLDIAGEGRFLAKTVMFKDDLSEVEADQCFYQGIMEALGYSENRKAFRELARRVPLADSLAVLKEAYSDDACAQVIQARLLMVAGLVKPRQGNHAHRRRTMSVKDWHFCHNRPLNSPLRRISAMSRLLVRYRGKSMVREIAGRLRDTSVAELPGALEEMLMVSCGSCGELPGPALLGRERAAVIVVNVVLPFMSAWGWHNSFQELASKAREVYHHYPRLSMNAIERHMVRQLGVSRDIVIGACRQQGLLHLYKTFCTQGKCGTCPLVKELCYSVR